MATNSIKLFDSVLHVLHKEPNLAYTISLDIMRRMQLKQNKERERTEIKNKGFYFFEAIGRFSIKFRWLVLFVWVAGTFAGAHYLPSLSDVTQSNNTSFLPANAPSQKAINLAAKLGRRIFAELR
jgi:hypothetical protein